ncbi:hypothetical protein ABIF16_002898 [Bradyrhizobium elkanii]
MAADVVTQIITARITEHVAESPFYIPMTRSRGAAAALAQA